MEAFSRVVTRSSGLAATIAGDLLDFHGMAANLAAEPGEEPPDA
jgi:hypothetical protein